MAGVLSITLEHAERKHAQTIGLVERSHSSIKQALKIGTGKRISKKPTHQNSKKQTMSQSREQIIKGVIFFTEFRWIGPYIMEEVLLNNNYLARKIGSNKTQVPHRMRLRQFTP